MIVEFQYYISFYMQNENLLKNKGVRAILLRHILNQNKGITLTRKLNLTDTALTPIFKGIFNIKIAYEKIYYITQFMSHYFL